MKTKKPVETLTKRRRLPRVPRRWLIVGYAAIAVTLGLLLGWFALNSASFGELGSALANANIALIFLAWLAVTGAGYLRGVRWRLILVNPRTTAVRLFLVEQTGTALDTFSPIRVLDEIVEIGILTVRDGIEFGRVVATLAAQRTFEFATTIVLLGTGTLLLPQFRSFWPYLLAGFAFGALSIVLLFSVGPIVDRVPLLKKIPIAPQFASAVDLMKTDRRRSLLAFSISIEQAALIGVSGWLIARATGIEIGILSMITISLGIMFFSSTVPGLPMALGTFEFATVSLLGLWDVPPHRALAFAVLFRAILFVPPIFFALFFLSREGLLSVKEIKAIAAQGRQRPRGSERVA
ncbi:MAG: flippase-like domain-containing protein [Chloroflexi bacterium]|nr:flippase-like domain-containing protein [Chloroflexota bacterium]